MSDQSKLFPEPAAWIYKKIRYDDGATLMLSPVALAVRILNTDQTQEAVLALTTELVEEVRRAVNWAVEQGPAQAGGDE